MAAGTLIQTKTLDKVLAVAKGITGIGSSRAFQGYKRWTDAENKAGLIKALTAETQGYFHCMLKSAGSVDDTVADRPETFDIIGELQVGIAKDTSSDLNTAWELALSLSNALALNANFNEADRGLGIPQYCRFSLLNVDVVNKGGIMIFDFGMYGGGGIRFLDP